MNIIGFYKEHALVERNGLYYVVNRTTKDVLFEGSEEEANKAFVMLIANFINEKFEVVI